MGESGMPRDQRVRGLNGRYETRAVAVGALVGAGVAVVAANGARVSLWFACQFNTETADTQALISSLSAPGTPLVLTLTKGQPTARISIETHGDLAFAHSLQLVGTDVVGLTVWETVWHPEDK